MLMKETAQQPLPSSITGGRGLENGPLCRIFYVVPPFRLALFIGQQVSTTSDSNKKHDTRSHFSLVSQFARGDANDRNTHTYTLSVSVHSPLFTCDLLLLKGTHILERQSLCVSSSSFMTSLSWYFLLVPRLRFNTVQNERHAAFIGTKPCSQPQAPCPACPAPPTPDLDEYTQVEPVVDAGAEDGEDSNRAAEPVPWGRLMRLSGGAAISLMPRPEQTQGRALNEVTLGRGKVKACTMSMRNAGTMAVSRNCWNLCTGDIEARTYAVARCNEPAALICAM